MLQALAFGLGAGAAIQAWRKWPADGAVNANSLALVFCVGLVVAYLGGRWAGRGRVSATATATAVATSEATASNSVNLAVFLPGQGAGSAPGVSLPTEAAPWMLPVPEHRDALSLDDLDGLDVSELLEARGETEPEHS